MTQFRLFILFIVMLSFSIITSAQTPIFSVENPIVTPENASQVTQLAMIGRGFPLDVAYSPDGTMVAVSSSVGVWIYNTTDFDAEPRFLFDVEQYGWSSRVAFSPDSRYIVTGAVGEPEGSSDNIVRMWDVQTGELINRFPHDKEMWAVAYSPDGRFIATGGDESTIYIWDAQTGQLFQMWEQDSIYIVMSLDYSPDGRFLIASYSDDISNSLIILWEVATGEAIQSQIFPNEYIKLVDYSPDGQFIAITGNPVMIWDVEQWALTDTYMPDIFAFNPLYSPDGKTIAMVQNESVQVFDVQTKDIIHILDRDMALGYALAFSPDGQFLASRAFSNSVAIWDMMNGEIAHTLMGFCSYMNDIAMSSDGAYIACGSRQELRVADIASLTDFQGIQSAPAMITLNEYLYYSTLDDLIYSPDGRYLATLQTDYSIIIWDAMTGAEVRHFTDVQLWGNNFIERRLAFSPDSRTIAAIDEGIIKLWDIETGEQIRQFIADKPIRDFAYSQAGDTIALYTSEADGDFYDVIVEVWDTATYTKQDNMLLNDVEYGLGFNNDVIATGDGRFIFYSMDYRAKTFYIWDVASELLLHKITVTGIIQSLDYSPDGQLILISNGNSLQLLRADTGELLQPLYGHTRSTSGFFSEDGQYIISYSSDGTARLWGVPADG